MVDLTQLHCRILQRQFRNYNYLLQLMMSGRCNFKIGLMNKCFVDKTDLYS